MLSQYKQEATTGYMMLALSRAGFSPEDMKLALDKLNRCFEKYPEDQAAAIGEDWLPLADPDTL